MDRADNDLMSNLGNNEDTVKPILKPNLIQQLKGPDTRLT